MSCKEGLFRESCKLRYALGTKVLQLQDGLAKVVSSQADNACMNINNASIAIMPKGMKDSSVLCWIARFSRQREVAHS